MQLVSSSSSPGRESGREVLPTTLGAYFGTALGGVCACCGLIPIMGLTIGPENARKYQEIQKTSRNQEETKFQAWDRRSFARTPARGESEDVTPPARTGGRWGSEDVTPPEPVMAILPR